MAIDETILAQRMHEHQDLFFSKRIVLDFSLENKNLRKVFKRTLAFCIKFYIFHSQCYGNICKVIFVGVSNKNQEIRCWIFLLFLKFIINSVPRKSVRFKFLKVSKKRQRFKVIGAKLPDSTYKLNGKYRGTIRNIRKDNKSREFVDVT